MDYKKEFVFADILYYFTTIIKLKKTIKMLTKYTYEQTKHDRLINYFDMKLLEKNFNKIKLYKNYSKKNKLRITNSFVRRRRITDDTPLLIF